jgi:hypothetical protein
MDLFFCKYKKILGEPNVGFHKHYFFGFAILDVIGTIFISILIGKYYNINVIAVFMILIIVSIFLHYIFCVETTLIKFFGM